MYEQKDVTYQSRTDVQKFIETLAKRKGFIIVFFLSATLFSLGLTYFVSEKYQAAITIFYHPVEASLLRLRKTESFGAPVPSAPFKVISQTLRDAVRNDAVLRPVVEKLNLAQDIKVEYPTWYERMYHEVKNYVKRLLRQAWQLLKHGRLIEEDPKIAAIKRLRENIDIVTTRDSYIYILKVKYKHATRAAKIVDLAGREMVEWLNKQQQGAAEERVRQLEPRVKIKRDEIANQQELKKSILEENDLVSISEETTKALTNLYQLELDEIRISAQVQKEDTQVAAYEEAVPEESSTYIQSEDIKSLKTQKLFGEIELKGLKAEKSFLGDSIKDLKDRLAKLPSLQKSLDAIDMNIASATREHAHLKDLHTEASAQAILTQSETKILHTAVVPSAPVQPIKVYHVALTGVLSLAFSVGLAFVMDFLGAGAVDSSRKAKHPGKRIKVSVSDELKQTLQVLKDFARELGAKGGSLFLRRGNSLVLAESLDPGHAPATIPLPLRKGSVFEQVMSLGQPIVVEDIEHKVGVHSSGWKGYSDNSLLAFPLSGKIGEPVGIVSHHNKAKHHFTQKDKERGIVGIVSLHNRLSGPFTEKDKERGVKILASHMPGKTRKHWLSRILWYPVIIICAAILAGLVFYFLLKIGF